MNHRILVVDDTVANIQTLAAILKDKGYLISVATNGQQALEVVGRVKPDLILLDVMMPGMDGFETCRRLKAAEPFRQIPVIFLTAKTETEDLVRGFELGAVDYVAKPFNAHELLARVSTHLMVDELRRNLAEKNAELARAHELVRRAFGRYVSEEVAASILQSPEGLELGGEEREVTILMSDLRGFTAQAARLSPHLEEKFVGRTVHEGRLASVSATEAGIQSELALAPLSNLKIEVISVAGSVPGGDIYAKVLPGNAESSPHIRVRFTSVSPELRSWLHEIAPRLN